MASGGMDAPALDLQLGESHAPVVCWRISIDSRIRLASCRHHSHCSFQSHCAWTTKLTHSRRAMLAGSADSQWHHVVDHGISRHTDWQRVPQRVSRRVTVLDGEVNGRLEVAHLHQDHRLIEEVHQCREWNKPLENMFFHQGIAVAIHRLSQVFLYSTSSQHVAAV